MEPNENEKFPGSESITGYKAWLFSMSSFRMTLDDLNVLQNIVKSYRI